MKISSQLRQAFEARIIAGYELKLKRYEQEITASIHQQYPLAQDTHYQLQLQQTLRLKKEIIDEIEAKVTQGYEQKLKQYHHDACQHLQLLRQELNLSREAVASIEKCINTPIEVEQKQQLQQYEEAFTRAIQRQYPFSDDEHEALENLRRILDLSETVTNEIEAEVTETYNSQPHLPTSAPQVGEDQEKVWRLLLKATVVAAAFLSVSLVGYVHLQWQDQSAKTALESTKILKEGKKYEECGNQASSVPQKSHFYADAQILLHECQRLAQDKKGLAQAKELAKKNIFKDARAEANKIQPDNSFRFSPAQISQCSKNPSGMINSSEAMPAENCDYLW